MAFDTVVDQLMRVSIGRVALHLEVVQVVLTSLLVSLSVDQTGLERDDCSRFRVCPRNGPPRDMCIKRQDDICASLADVLSFWRREVHVLVAFDFCLLPTGHLSRHDG